MKTKGSKCLLLLILLLVGVSGTLPLEAANTYQATWASVDTHNPAPEWFQDAKFGLWFHWGAYSVPAYGSEWYPRNMYNKGSNEYNHHVATYGDPYSNWPYHNFINGANNKAGQWTQFAPKLASAGGNFDPNAWAQLFVDAGAKMAGPVAEHHDGFSLWNSSCNEWNAAAKGPMLDLVGQFATAFRAKGLKFLVSTHTAYNFTGYYQWVPAQSDNSLKKLYGQSAKADEETLWLNKQKELVDNYQPDYMWNDFNLAQVSESVRLNFLAYYYNKAIDWGKEVVVSYNDGFNTNGEIHQVERGGNAGLTYPFWLSEDTLSLSTWCYTQGMSYYSAKSVLDALIDRVSKNGCLLLDICPMWDGTIPQAQKDILTTMGSWLKKYGEAIYSTRPYVSFGEGPTTMGGGGMGAPMEGTATDIRFTRNKANNVLYAIAMGWPSGNQMVITSLKSGSFDSTKIIDVSFLGGGSCSWTQDSTGLKVNLPSNLSDSLGYAVKISLSGAVANATFYQDYDYAGTSVSLGAGNYTQSQLAAAGIADNSISSVRVPSGIQVQVFADDNFGGSSWTFTADTPNFGTAGCNDVMSSVKITDTTGTPAPTAAPMAVPTIAPTPVSGTVSLACGSTSVVGDFQPDQYYSGGSTFNNTNTIDVSLITNNPPPAALFNNERYGTISYTIPGFTAGSAYNVTLYFAETYLTSSGGRLFNVTINGAAALSNFDIYANAGAQNKAIAKSFMTTADSSGQIVIQFTAVTENAKINGIAIVPGANVGTMGDVNGSGTVDIVDALLIAQYYVGLNPSGFVAANADVNCTGTIDIVDALVVAQYYVGLVSSFPC
jgi:alpha-L-fucosidase